ncbi:hypothetical protein [Nocardioides sp. B-3]|uniref:hypothetical protein n=1 Tax=Nocardioides sp. B-3 TaxID=2895565 RepID=UPI0021531D86|nr:hypothetical protein [Nocardioides sp. B-3]UUZ59292.1 hypothetical protein LP418_26110 [Nocardioides sp. B-3]
MSSPPTSQTAILRLRSAVGVFRVRLTNTGTASGRMTFHAPSGRGRGAVAITYRSGGEGPDERRVPGVAHAPPRPRTEHPGLGAGRAPPYGLAEVAAAAARDRRQGDRPGRGRHPTLTSV